MYRHKYTHKQQDEPYQISAKLWCLRSSWWLCLKSVQYVKYFLTLKCQGKVELFPLQNFTKLLSPESRVF